jgi:hypothetical protein
MPDTLKGIQVKAVKQQTFEVRVLGRRYAAGAADGDLLACHSGISPDSHFCKYEKLKPATAMNRPTEHIPAQTWLRPRLPGYRVAGTFQIRDNPGCVAEMAE